MHLRDIPSDHPFPQRATIRLGEIWRDPDVASIPVRENHVAELKEQFRPHLVGYPIVSRRSDGQIVVLNGSHRCEALRAMFGDDLEIDATLYDGLTRDQEVALFERHHKKYLKGEQRAGKQADDEARVWTFDYDGTISAAPEQLSRIGKGLKAQGDKLIVLTGNKMPHADLLSLLDGLDFPYDEVVQYHDDESNGIVRAHYLKQFDTWGAFDNRIDRAVIFAPVCPHLYLVVEPTKEDKQNAKGTKKDAKQAAKDVGLRSRLQVNRYHETRSLDPHATVEDEDDWA